MARSSARISSCPPTAPTPRPVPVSPRSCSPGACSWPPGKHDSPISPSEPCTTWWPPHRHQTAAPSSTPTHCISGFPGWCRHPTSSATAPPPACASPGSPSHVARPTSPGLLPRWPHTWPPPTTRGSRSTNTRTAGSRRPLGNGRRVSVDVGTKYPAEGKISIRVNETDGSSWALTLRVPPWSSESWLVVAGERKKVGPGQVVGRAAASPSTMWWSWSST